MANFEISEILDLSYKGFSIPPPGLYSLKSRCVAELSVELGSAPPFRSKARIVWSNLEVVGGSCGVASRRPYRYDGLPPGQIVGAGLKPWLRLLLDRSNLSIWYQGPQDTMFLCGRIPPWRSIECASP